MCRARLCRERKENDRGRLEPNSFDAYCGVAGQRRGGWRVGSGQQRAGVERCDAHLLARAAATTSAIGRTAIAKGRLGQGGACRKSANPSHGAHLVEGVKKR